MGWKPATLSPRWSWQDGHHVRTFSGLNASKRATVAPVPRSPVLTSPYHVVWMMPQQTPGPPTTS